MNDPISNLVRQDTPKAAIRQAAKRFARVLEQLVPEGGNQEIALTKIREATAWACEGINREGSDA